MKKIFLLLTLFIGSFLYSQSIGIVVDSEIQLYNSLPKTFIDSDGKTHLNYPKQTTLKHYEDGFREYIRPSYDVNTQRLGAVIFDVANDIFTNEIIELSDEQIQSSLISISQSLKQELIQQALAQQIEDEAQSKSDTEALDSKNLFPIWETGIAYQLNHKVQYFTIDNELVLYKVVQAHTSQSNWQPREVPSLFTRLAYPGTIPDFIQPTGSQDTYSIGDQVYFPAGSSVVYESLINNNVYSPTAYPQGWLLIE